MRVRGLALVVIVVQAPILRAQEAHEGPSAEGHHLADSAIPLQVDEVAERPRLLLELGERFLATGELGDGIRIPTGAIWRPALWVYGTYRTSLQTFDDGPTHTGEWANRLDLFANLRLSGTERVLVGFRPLDATGGVGYNFESGGGGWQDDFNGRLETLFIEGDVGEIFPSWDDDDNHALDIGFAVGRQDVSFQEGLLIRDNLDAVGLTRNSLRPSGMSNFRLTALYSWNNIHRKNVEDNSAHLIALLTEMDFPVSTVALDAVVVLSDDIGGNGFYGGVSAVQRIGRFNTAFRVNGSVPIDQSTDAATLGFLWLNEVSWTPHHTHNLIYVNSFWALGEFSSAARGPAAGGPLGRAGILFASTGIGRFGSPLSNEANDVVGGSIGYQMFFAHTRRQLVLELAGRKDTDGIGAGALGAGARLQQAIGRRLVLRLDAFAAAQEGSDGRLGARIETLLKM